MEKILKIVSWIEVILGGVSILSSFSSENFYQFVGGALFLGAGVVALRYISETKLK